MAQYSCDVLYVSFDSSLIGSGSFMLTIKNECWGHHYEIILVMFFEQWYHQMINFTNDFGCVGFIMPQQE